MPQGVGPTIVRIRTIKPEFWQSESMAGASRDSRLVAIALLNYADDEGIFLANERVFRGALFPFDDDLDILGAFQELSKNGFIAFAEHSGKTLGKILNFKVHQRIDKPQKSRFSAENAVFGSIPGMFRECSGNVPGMFQESSATEVEVEREEEKGKEPATPEIPDAPVTSRAPTASPAAPAWGPEQALAIRQERWSARRQDWLANFGEPVDFTKRPTALTFLSYCRAVHPSWQSKFAKATYDTWAAYNWTHGGKRIGSWWQLADAFADGADQTEHFDAFMDGSGVKGLDISSMSSKAAGITSGERL